MPPPSLIMLYRILFFILYILIRIGDAVLFVFYTTSKRIQLFFSSQFHKRKSVRHTTPLSFSILTKLKYFVLGSIFSLFFVFLPLLLLTIVQLLPNPSQLSQNLAPQTTKIFDRHNRLLYAIYANQNRTNVSLSDIPQSLQEATIAIEDKNFYKNPGFDITAIIRAAVSDFIGGTFQGGSTITQQLIKSSLLNSHITIGRKIQEVLLAFWAEKLYSKKQILSMYFNQVPYGGTAWGVEAAAQTYFGKSIKNIDLAQAAFLAGMPQAPTTYSPFGENPSLWKKRQTEVLDRMQELGFISKNEKIQAIDEDIHFQPQSIPIYAPHFVYFVKDLLVKKYGLPLVEKGGLHVYTTLDLDIQNMAQNAVTTEINQDSYLGISNGAALVTDPKTGDILAMVGSANYDNPDGGNVNVTLSPRQPGSTIKVVTYSAALSHGFTAASILDDSPVSFVLSDNIVYSPVNYDGRFHGKIPLRLAFANSFNVPAVRTLNAVGLPVFLDLAKRMGLDSLDTTNTIYGLSATLGGLDATMKDMVTVYGTIANSGKRIDINPFLKITDANGTILEEKMQIPHMQIIAKGIAYIIANILADNIARTWEFGTNSPLQITGHTVSVKTGTSDDKRDNWTIGFTPHILTAVWVGNNDNSPMSQSLASGITGAAPIWHTIMTNLLKNSSDESFSLPDDVITKSCSGKIEYFLKGTENSVNCNFVSPSPTLH
jgi:penicillin-binding protein 1C